MLLAKCELKEYVQEVIEQDNEPATTMFDQEGYVYCSHNCECMKAGRVACQHNIGRVLDRTVYE